MINFSGSKIRILSRFLPLLLAIGAIALVGKFQPAALKQLLEQVEVRLNLKKAQTLSPENTLEAISSARASEHLKPYTHQEKLDETAKLLALSVIDVKADENKIISIKQAALAAGYDYQTIVYLATIDTLPLIQQPTTSWITSKDKDLFNNNFSEIGTAQVENTLSDPHQLVTVVVLATPLQKSPTQTTPPSSTSYSRPNYTGVQLWQEIQKYRREHGVPEFKQDNVLCTLASIRVTHLVQLGKLDDHEGFSPLVDEYRKNGQLSYGNLAENILMGYPTPQTAVAAWDGSLGHQALMKDGSYVWGCAAANSGFAVLIAAY